MYLNIPLAAPRELERELIKAFKEYALRVQGKEYFAETDVACSNIFEYVVSRYNKL